MLRVAVSEPDPLREALRSAHERARRVAHPRVVVALELLEDADGLRASSVDPSGIELDLGLERGSALPAVTVAWLGMQVLEALMHAHALGIAHGRVAPVSVWVTAEGNVSLDFGLSQAGAEPREDVRAVAALVRDASSGPLPEPLGRVLESALEAPPDAEALELDLVRVFHRDLGADELEDGRDRLASWVAEIRRGPAAAPAPELGPRLMWMAFGYLLTLSFWVGWLALR